MLYSSAKFCENLSLNAEVSPGAAIGDLRNPIVALSIAEPFAHPPLGKAGDIRDVPGPRCRACGQGSRLALDGGSLQQTGRQKECRPYCAHALPSAFRVEPWRVYQDGRREGRCERELPDQKAVRLGVPGPISGNSGIQ
jgi:hypothetical protein